MTAKLSDTLESIGYTKELSESWARTLLGELSVEGESSLNRSSIKNMPLVAFVLMEQGRQELASNGYTPNEKAKAHFSSAYSALKSVFEFYDQTAEVREDEKFHIIEECPYVDDLRELGLSNELSFAFLLCVCGVLSDRLAEVRHDLREFELEVDESNWLTNVSTSAFIAQILLVRKYGGWSDLERAFQIISTLTTQQVIREPSYFRGIPDDERLLEASKVIALYHVIQSLQKLGEYLVDGTTGRSDVFARMESHFNDAIKAISPNALNFKADSFQFQLALNRKTVENSIWSHAEQLPGAIKSYIESIAARERSNPLLELWPSQQQALRSNLFDSYPRAITIQMPTSAGKTLLAKFSILQSLSLNNELTVAYLVPTKALVNQISSELRSDFKPLGFSVEAAIPAFEMDPLEKRLLSADTNVLVTTPEKFDLLIRSGHDSVKNLGLVVVDEAHNISDGTRGLRLELVLSTVKRERPSAKFLLLSPFIENGDQLARWLGDDRSLPPIKIDWKPSNRLVVSLKASGNKSKRSLFATALPSIDNVEGLVGKKIKISDGGKLIEPNGNTLKGITRNFVNSRLSEGSTLVLCRGKGTARTRAEQIATDRSTIIQSEYLEAVCAYIEQDVGRATSLTNSLRKGVAYHHAGLSPETRILVESLIKKGLVDVVCGTTTLAQGVNFPITSVVIETVKKGNVLNLEPQEFWNIAGRAGRALVDSIGVIAFPNHNKDFIESALSLLTSEARQVSSELIGLLSSISDVERFSLGDLRTLPQLSSLLQFIAHAAKISGQSKIAEEMELLLRSSLAYQDTSHRKVLNDFIEIGRRYASSLNQRTLGLADQTGFATPSVDFLMANLADNQVVRDRGAWESARLFENKEHLTGIIDLISRVPEINLGDGREGDFSPDRIADILTDWVHGRSISEMAKEYAKNFSEVNPDKDTEEFASYLYSKLVNNTSWGFGALQSLALPSRDEEDGETGDSSYIPSMLFFGVDSKEATWLRSVGAPRFCSAKLGKLWKDQKGDSPESYKELRGWISSLDSNQWGQVIPPASKMSGRQMKMVWEAFEGN